jgi:hypothetical protein
MVKLPASPEKEGRYWAFEFPIALLLITGVIVIGLGVPHIISRSTNWATLFIGAGEVILAACAFYMARLNAIRVIAAAAIVAGAIAFYMGLSAVY